MRKAIAYAVFSIILFPIIASFVSASSISFSGIENQTETYQDMIITFNSSVAGYRIFIQRPNDLKWYNFSYINIGSGNSFTIPADFIQTQGLYRFYIKHDSNSKRIPSEPNTYLHAFASNRNTEFFDAIFSYGDKDPTSGCKVWAGDRTCGVETIQAKEIERFGLLYFLSGNQTYLNISYELLTNNWNSAIIDNFNCDPFSNNYNCDSIGGIILGSEAQGLIINSLFKTYSYTKNKSFKGFAINFSNSNSDICNVWIQEYNCTNSKNHVGSSRAQGRMIQAYAHAYKYTNNNHYLEIMNGLADFVINNPNYFLSSIELAIGFSNAYFLTNNETFRNLSEYYFLNSYNTADISRKSEVVAYVPYILSFDSFEKKDNNGFSINISKYSYHYSKIQNLAMDYISKCLDNNYNCSSGSNQRSLTIAMHNFANIIPYSGLGFYGHNYLGRNETDYFFQIHFSSPIENPKMFYRDAFLLGNFSNVSISDLGIAVMPDGFSSKSLVIEYYFQGDNGYRYPANSNTFTYAVPLTLPRSAILIRKLNNFIMSAPFMPCNPFNNKFSCRYEDWHGDYINSLSKASIFNSSLINLIDSLVFNKIDDSAGNVYSTCEPYLDSFLCFYKTFRSGIMRAMSLANGYTSYYFHNKTHDPVLYSKNLVYLSDANSYDSCNVWKNNFKCSNAEEQYKYISSVLNLYEITGDETLYKKLHNLTDALYEFSNSSEDYYYIIQSFIKTYSLFGNSTSKEKIISYIENEHSNCINNNCSTSKYYNLQSIIWKAYGIFENSEVNLYSIGDALSRESPYSSFQDYCTGQSLDSAEHFICLNPSEQSIAINSYFNMMQNYIMREPPNFTIDVWLNTSYNSSNQAYEAGLFNLINVTCSITNQGSLNATTEVSISSPFMLFSDNSSIELKDIQASETRNATFIINASRAHRSQITCSASQFDNSTNLDVFYNQPLELIPVTLENFASESNNYSLSFSLYNNYSFPIYDILILFSNLDSISSNNLKNITNQTFVAEGNFQWDNESISLVRLFSNEYFNFTLFLDPSQPFVDDLIFNITSAHNGSKYFGLPIIVDFDEFEIVSSFNTNPFLYQPNQGYFNIYNSKGYDVNNLNISLDFNNSKINITSSLISYNGKNISIINDSIVLDSFNNSDELRVYVNYSLLKDSLNNDTKLRLFLEFQDIFESRTVHFTPNPEILSLSLNNINDFYNTTNELKLELKDILFINQSNISINISYDDSVFKIDMDSIKLPYNFFIKRINTSIDSLLINGVPDSTSWIANLSDYDGSIVSLKTTKQNDEFSIKINSSHSNLNHSISNITYEIILEDNTSMLDGHVLDGFISIFNQSGGLNPLASIGCGISSFPHKCVLPGEFFDDVISVFNLTLKRTSPISNITSLVDLTDFSANYLLDKNDALFNLSDSSDVFYVKLFSSSNEDGYFNVSANHTNKSFSDTISINYNIFSILPIPEFYLLNATLTLFNDTHELSSDSCISNTNFNCNSTIALNQEFNSSLKIELIRTHPHLILDKLNVSDSGTILSTNLDLDLDSAKENLSNYDGNTISLLANSTLNKSFINIKPNINLNNTILAFPWVNFSIQAFSNGSAIPENHTLNLTVKLMNNTELLKNKECIFDKDKGEPFVCNITAKVFSDMNLIYNVSFMRINDFDSQETLYELDFINISQKTFDNQTKEANVSYISVEQIEYNSSSSLNIDFINITHYQENRSYLANIVENTSSLISLFMPQALMEEGYEFLFPGRLLKSGQIYAEGYSYESGFAEIESNILLKPDPSSGTDSGPGSGGGGGGGSGGSTLIPETPKEENKTTLIPFLPEEPKPTSKGVLNFSYYSELNIDALYLFKDYFEILGINYLDYIAKYHDEIIDFYDCFNSYQRTFIERNQYLRMTLYLENNCDKSFQFYFIDSHDALLQSTYNIIPSHGILIDSMIDEGANQNYVDFPDDIIAGIANISKSDVFLLSYNIDISLLDQEMIEQQWLLKNNFIAFPYFWEITEDKTNLIVAILSLIFKDNLLILLGIFIAVIIGLIIYFIAVGYYKYKKQKIVLDSGTDIMSNHEIIMSLGIQSVYLGKLIREGDFEKAESEYEKIYKNYQKYNSQLSSAGPEVADIIQEEIKMLSKFHEILLASTGKHKKIETASSPNLSKKTEEENQDIHYEHDILLRIKAIHMELVEKNIFRAKQLFDETQSKFTKLTDDDLHGQRDIFEKRLAYLEKTIEKITKKSFKYRLFNLLGLGSENEEKELMKPGKYNAIVISVPLFLTIFLWSTLLKEPFITLAIIIIYSMITMLWVLTSIVASSLYTHFSEKNKMARLMSYAILLITLVCGSIVIYAVRL